MTGVPGSGNGRARAARSADLATLRQFFAAVRGRSWGFRFRDNAKPACDYRRFGRLD